MTGTRRIDLNADIGEEIGRWRFAGDGATLASGLREQQAALETRITEALLARPDGPIFQSLSRVGTEVRQQLVEFRSGWRDHQVAYPRFVASAEAVGCGQIIPDQPLTPLQAAYVREHEAVEASGVLPAWVEKWAALDAERLVLHRRALALDATPRPATSSSCCRTSSSTGMPSSPASRQRRKGRPRRRGLPAATAFTHLDEPHCERCGGLECDQAGRGSVDR